MSRVIPKEQLTAYQRWELGSIDSGSLAPGSVAHDSAAPSSPPPAADPEPEPVLSVPLPTAEDLERIQRDAWQEGYDLGLEEGRKAGHEAGYEAGYVTGEAHAERLRQLAEALQVEALRQDEAIAQELLVLALNVAQQILRSTIQVKPESILVVIREALQSLPTLSGHHKIVVHPDDAEVVREWLDKEHGHLSWKVLEDTQMSPGSFRFEGANNELDASMETRWREITACLGTEMTWMG